MTLSQSSDQPTTQKSNQAGLQRLIVDLLLVVILLVGAYLRFTGIDWGEYSYLHPDERFLIWVGSDIQPIGQTDNLGAPPTSSTPGYEWRGRYLDALPDCTEWGGYFDASCSPLNPQNRSHGFYVYGTLPMFITRYVVEWVYGHSGFVEMTDIGRTLSAASDLLTVFLIFLVAAELFNRRVGLLAAAFAAVQVLPIQQSHFFTMDTFTNMFGLLAFYAAARIVRTANLPGAQPPVVEVSEEDGAEPVTEPARWQVWLGEIMNHPYFWWSILFGAAYGAALASKLSIYPLALLLPAAMLIHFFKVPVEQRSAWSNRVFAFLVIGGAVAVLVFRIGQPYAFKGPGFFNIMPNPAWVANIVEQRNQAAGDIDFPPSLQWARRSLWFSGENLTLWGLGLPLGILGWVGFLWAAWRMLRPFLRVSRSPWPALSNWDQNGEDASTLPGLLLVWAWTAGHFAWVSSAFNPTMRYQLPIYPTFAMLAAWAIITLYDHVSIPAPAHAEKIESGAVRKDFRIGKWAAWITGAAVLLATTAWAFAFLSIYQRPITRVAASRWIYENIPGPLNVSIETDAGDVRNQTIAMPYSYTIRQDVPYYATFNAKASGVVNEIHMPHILDIGLSSGTASLTAGIFDNPGKDIPLSNTIINVDLTPQGTEVFQALDRPVAVSAGQVLYLVLGDPRGNSMDICGGDISLYLQTANDYVEVRLAKSECSIILGQSILLPFAIPEEGTLTEIYLGRVAGEAPPASPATLTFTLQPVGGDALAVQTSVTSFFSPGPDGKGQSYTLQFDSPLNVTQDIAYQLIVNLKGSSGVQFNGSSVANEGDWDDGLPLRLDGYDGFGGVFTPGLNFNMYTDENYEKLQRFKHILDETEYIFISSNRQWGSLPRLPERFPLSTAYYRALLGCPADKEIFWCYAVAEPGMFQGKMGFELVQVFQSDPTLGGISINDQFAEEAFHVYDHPKVLIFKKTADYQPVLVNNALDVVNLNAVVHITPKKAGDFPATLLLSEETLAQQQAGGTWSELFDTSSPLNVFQPLGVIVWYLAVLVLGLVAYPILRLALGGLPDRGYPLARTAGLLLLSWMVWFASSKGIPFTWPTITAALLLMAAMGIILAYLQRAEIRQELRQRWRYFLSIEGLFLAFFLLFLLVRLANPDLWHPWKGGERPMDFSYFNAALKSTSFPPYDPWYAGGYMNYYYYGFVYSGVLVKWLGLVPSFAFNLILPTMFSLTAMGAFSGAWNLAAARRKRLVENGTLQEDRAPYFAGLSGAALMVLLGNLGSLRMIMRGYQILVDPTLAQEGASLFVRWKATIEGFGRVLSGASFPYSPGDWYWIPSRVMPPGDNAITEFPLFTFLYSDPHAHLFALSIALLALGWVLSWALANRETLFTRKDDQSPGQFAGVGALAASIFIGALAVGALRPTNTWDSPTYLALGLVAMVYSFWKLKDTLETRLIGAGMSMAGFIFLSNFLFHPFTQWYGQAYGKIEIWKGPVTPLNSYFTHWGLFLFLIISFLSVETLDWMRRTPASALRTVRWEVVWGLVTTLAVFIGLLAVNISGSPSTAPFGRGIVVALVALPLAAWAGVLLLRRSDSEGRDPKRAILFMIGTGLTITLFVEMIVLAGDIGRQNTVFKLYLQTWTLFAVCGGAILHWMYDELDTWQPRLDIAWQIALILLVSAAALFPLTGGWAKMTDRMTPEAPRSLNAMDYMQYSRYNESGFDMDLSEDYRAIRWMQENISGSPVIVEANSGNLYRWYLRYTIYTGLPSVVGWEWHQQQQRALNSPALVSSRLREIQEFYTTENPELARQFLQRYNVHYIVLGQLERATYSGAGLDKFTQFNGTLWQAVYIDGDTVIYEVMP